MSMKFVAHRGFKFFETENTLEAFQYAMDVESCYGIETDVYKTIDDHFVLIHDNDLSIITNKKYKTKVNKSTLREIKTILLPNKNGEYDGNERRIPTLKEGLELIKTSSKVLFLEFKEDFNNDDIKKIIDIIVDNGMLDRVVFISFFKNVLLRVRNVLPKQKCMLLLNKFDNKSLEFAKINNIGLDINFEKLSKINILKILENKVLLNVFTVNNLMNAKELSDLGIDLLTSDWIYKI